MTVALRAPNLETRQAQAASRRLSTPEAFFSLLQIPEGSFSMGYSDEPDLCGDEQPVHTVHLRSFLISPTLVTQQQWMAVSLFPWRSRHLRPYPSVFKVAKEQRSSFPVDNVSWLDALEFCYRLSDFSGLRVVLPSEAQWEYACRAGSRTLYSHGNTLTTGVCNFEGSAKMRPSSILEYAPNSWGLYDMHGNLSEWCLDDWEKDYSLAPCDGTAWLSGDLRDKTVKKVMRGGSWNSPSDFCRSASRLKYYPRHSHGSVGFRIAVEISAPNTQHGSPELKDCPSVLSLATSVG